MSKLLPTVDVLEAIPDERLRSLYDQDPETGAFKLYEPVAKALDVSGLTSALDKERKSNKTFDQQLKAFKAATGADTAEEVQAMIEQLKSTGGGKDVTAQLEKMKAEMELNLGKKVAGKDEELKAMQVSLERHLVDAEAATAIAQAEGSAKLLLPHVKNSVKVFNEGGNYVVRVVDSEGDPRGDGRGGYMTIRDLITEMKNSEDFAAAFKPSGVTGSGTRPPAPKGPQKVDTASLNPQQKIAMALNQKR